MDFSHLFALLNLKHRGSVYISDPNWIPMVYLELRDRGLVDVRHTRVSLTNKGESEVNESIQVFRKRYQ